MSALEISVSVAFSASLTGTPPMPRNILRCFSNVLANLLQPALKGCRIARRLDVDYRGGLPQYLDALVFDLSGLAALERVLQSVTGGAPFGRTEIGALER